MSGQPCWSIIVAAIVCAIANLEASRWDLAGQFIVLNAWNNEIRHQLPKAR
ncbi:MAG TPA: hypothetical protein VNJ09_02525 [Chthonomonadales bacterium]|nr:hypothetical protein [Chthonomonadales bacterium]